MLTGYKIKGEEIAVDTSSKISQRTSNHFKPISGNTFKNNKGQLKVLPNTDNSYYKSSEEGYACYGSSTSGGSPDVELIAPGTYYFKFTNTSDRLLLQYGTEYSGKNLSGHIHTISSYKMYNGYFPKAVKMWIALCGGGGGGLYDNGYYHSRAAVTEKSSGGSGAASCMFSYTTNDYDSMLKIVVGKGGTGGRRNWNYYTGSMHLEEDVEATSGGDSKISIGHYIRGAWEFSDQWIAHGGKAGTKATTVPGGTFEGTLPQQDLVLQINGAGTYSYGGSGGNGDGYVAGGNSILITSQYFNNTTDYNFIYKLTDSIHPISIAGGAGETGSADSPFNVGGGACAFYGSVAGSYTKINATLGSGGGCARRGDAARFGNGGDGGNGACHLWVSGSNHYEVDDDVTACVTPLFNLGITVFLFPYDLNSDTTIEITYDGTWSSSVTKTKTVDSWKTFFTSGEVKITSAIIKSI